MSIPAEVLINNPTISRMAEAVLQRGLVSRAASGFSVASLISSFMDLQVARQVVDPRHSRPPNAARNPGRMVFVLAGPRSGSTLTQLVLNMHSQLYAGQELYLLPFFTMKERAERLGSRELSSWVFEGLRKTVMELRGCTIEEADELLEQMTDFRTQDVLSILQAWAGERILVDKTPPYVWSMDTLRRAEQLFEEVQYVHVYRHPYANISSMATEAINRDFIADAAGAAAPAGWEQQVCRALSAQPCACNPPLSPRGASLQLDDALWTEAETLWARGNANVLDFFKELPESRRLSVAYEDLLRAPDTTARRLCGFLRLPYEAAMCAPYTAANLATFEPAAAGGLGAGDPKLRQNTGIDATMADAWQSVKVPRALLPFAAHVAKELGYKLPAWKEPTLRPGAPAALVRLNAATGGTPVVVVHGITGTVTRLTPLAEALSMPVFGLRMSRRELAFETIEELAGEYVSALASLDLPGGIFIAATDEFGAQLGCTIARKLDERRFQGHAQTPRALSLVFLDCSLSGSLYDALTTKQRTLWELALEASALSGQREPELAPFLEGIGACKDGDELLELMATAFRPPELAMPKWDALVSRLVNCALKMLPMEAAEPLGRGNAVLLCSDAGLAARLPSRNAREWTGVFSSERATGVEQLLAPDAAERVAAALEKLVRSFTPRRR